MSLPGIFTPVCSGDHGTSVDLLEEYRVGKTYRVAGGLPTAKSSHGWRRRIPGEADIFGPVELAGSIGDYGRGRFFFRIGRTL
jgi:NTE family protein